MADAFVDLKSCDTIPAPQNLAVRVGTRQLDGLRTFADNGRQGDVDMLDAQDDSSASTSASARADPNGKTVLPLVSAVGKIVTPSPVPPPRHLCVRHQRTADEGTNRQLQESLNALPIVERQMINTLWSMFSSSTHANRAIILQGILTMCCSSQLSLLSEQVPQLLRIDPFFVLPREVGLRVLKFLDATSLARAAQVSRTWQCLADDDILWRNMCEQHIEKKCARCGWGLPLLEKKRSRGGARPNFHSVPSTSSSSSIQTVLNTNNKRRSPFGDDDPPPDQQSSSSSSAAQYKRRKLVDSHTPSFTSMSSYPSSPEHHPAELTAASSSSSNAHNNPLTIDEFREYAASVTRPWKDVYSERLKIERNWRRGRYSVTTLKGHTDGVMCLQLNETLSHPAFPVLISGSYDRTVRVWNLETGAQIGCLKGHTRAVRALQFDEVKLITGSMDRTLRVWNWRTGKCIRVLEGHSEGVVSLAFDADVLASGSVDTTVKVWNLKKGDCFTLRGHEDWVNSVKLWDSNASPSSASSSSSCSSASSSSSTSSPHFDSSESYDFDARAKSPTATDGIDMVGKMLFSASDDCTIRLWDLRTRSCVREFRGHVGQVQSIKMIYSEGDDDAHHAPPSTAGGNGSGHEAVARGDVLAASSSSGSVTPTGSFEAGASSSSIAQTSAAGTSRPRGRSTSSARPLAQSGGLASGSSGVGVGGVHAHAPEGPRPLLISGSLDNTLKLWDVETGQELMTYFGHIEGVWGVASDKLRLVSASHDRTIKIWDRENDKSSHTLVGHRGAVTCLDLADDKIVSGSDDAEIRVWSFAPTSSSSSGSGCP